jgi:hypothetical protein
MRPNLVILASHKIHLTLEKGLIDAITLGHKIQLTLKKGTHPCNTYMSQNTFYIGKKTHPCNTYISNRTYSGKGTHLCNTCISNATYTRKGSPSMQYLHIKCNLHWKKRLIHAIPTYQIQPTLEKGPHPCNTYISNETYTKKRDPCI